MELGCGRTPSGAQMVYCSCEPARLGFGSRTLGVQPDARVVQCRCADEYLVSIPETRTGGVR